VKYELKNSGKTTLSGVPRAVSVVEATPAKDMTPGTTEQFVVKLRFDREGRYEVTMQLDTNKVLIVEAPLAF